MRSLREISLKGSARAELPVVEAFKKKHSLEKLVIVADAGLLSYKNIIDLCDLNYEFILGSRIKNVSEELKEQLANLQLKDGQSSVIIKENGHRLIICYSSKRAKKDAYNRKRGLEKLEKAVASGKLGKKHINNRGHNNVNSGLEMKIDVSFKLTDV